MSDWRTTGNAGWSDETGDAVYHVTKGSKSLNAGDHMELERLLVAIQERNESADRMATALSELTVELAANCEDGMTESSDSFCEAREALGEWRALNK
ncbi:hypothetical protein J7J47_16410 [Halomonas sp. ISL-60]|uniref:hypothetical protein n=1 Tax=Halomonas sp. ISL-56 TaxID=2819149 RepID=UPI001BE6D619|nr:hypothetical protein [Halomonas sp. ISL-56]MBT2773806.1 hypothetical protein [Halomonas sp. ISL-60]MBT2800010.1 hypothetical protein [Halomonas sp. ISL-56]